MDRQHLKYVILNKNNVWYRLYYNYATLHAPPPSPHNKSYDNIDIGGLVVWLTYTYTLIVIISINNTTYQTMFAIIYTSTCTPPPTSREKRYNSNDCVPVFIQLAMHIIAYTT